jgi:hypothetical protein
VQARLQELGIQMNTTPDAEQQQPVAPAAGRQAPGTTPEQGVAEDQLAELSPATLGSYGRKAAGQAGWAHGVASAIKGPEGDQYAKFQQKRAAGVKQAVGKGANVNMGNVEPYDWAKQGGYGDANNPAMRKRGVAEDQLDELSPSTLSNYVNQAVDDVADRSNSTGFRKGARVASQAFAGGSKEPGRFEKDPKIANRKVGISRAIGRMAENTELNDMLKYAGVPISESRIHENSEYTHEIVAKTLAREKPGMATLKTSKDFYNAVYHELIAIGMTPRSARNLISYDEDFIGDVATSYNHYQSNPGLDEDNVSIMPEGAAVDAYMAGKSPAIAHFADQLDKNTEIKEGSCNATMEGEYCPEHGLTECGMYEMGTVAGSVAPVMGEQQEAYYESKADNALLARIKSLALLK